MITFFLTIGASLSLKISGDTPTSLIVSLVCFKGPLTLSKTYLEQRTSYLNASKSARDFSRDTIRSLHLIQIYKERPSSLETITSRKEVIRETQLFCIPTTLNKFVALLASTTLLHNLQTRLAMLKLV